MQFPFWSASVIEIDAWCKEATVFRKDGRTVFTTGVFSDTATGLTQKNWFLLGSNHPEKMVRFLGCTYQHIMDYYLSKYGTLWASALRDAKEPNRLLEKGSFVFQREFEYNGTGYNLYVLGRDV